MSGPVKIVGLKEVQAALKEIGDLDTAKEIRVALKAGAEIIAADARGRVPSRSGRAAGSITSGTAGARAFVEGGKKTVPYYGWLDFGSRHPMHGNTRREGPWRGSGTGPKDGRFLYPAVAAKEDELTAHVETGVNAVIKRVGLNG